MKIIIDAYNVLHQVIKGDHIAENDRKRFINQLSAYAKKRGHDIIVVFDAGPFLFPVSEQQKGITVKYSGPRESADDIILRYIKEHVGHSMLLVSSDRELCQAACYYDNIDVVDAQDFYDILTQNGTKRAAVPKLDMQAVKMGDSSEKVDMLMRQTSVSKKTEDIRNPLQEERQSQGYTTSKRVKKRLHKIKKL